MARELAVTVEIRGHDLPGLRCARSDGTFNTNVHGGIQRGRVPDQLVPGDAAEVRWQATVRRIESANGFDFKGAHVQGRAGERFLYITWGDVDAEGNFAMFRRAKLMLDDIPAERWDAAATAGTTLHCNLGLSDARGNPLCARVKASDLRWDIV